MSKALPLILSVVILFSAVGYVLIDRGGTDNSNIENQVFKCGSGEELTFEKVDDGISDCEDGSDESNHNLHVHNPPVLEAILVTTNTEQFVAGNVIHDHPMEVRIVWSIQSAEGSDGGNNLATDMNGSWTFVVEVLDRSEDIVMTFKAHNLPEDTWSDQITITIPKEIEETNQNDSNSTQNNNTTVGNNTGNETNNNTTTFLPPGLHNFTIQQVVDGEIVNRSILVNVPSFSDELSIHPIIFGLHGNGGIPSQFVGGWLDELVEEYGMIAVYPEGVERSWNLGKESSQADEIEFFDELFSLLSMYSNLDINQKYAVGISNGAGMLHTLGDHNNSFNGIVPIVTSLTTENIPTQTGSHPAVLQILGEDDPLVPIDGGIGVAGHDFLAANQSVYTWAMHNNCSSTPEDITLEDGSYHLIYRNCFDGKTVEGYIVTGAGHSIPVGWNGGLKNLVWNFISSTMSSQEIIIGCMDEAALNYDPMANQDSPEICVYDENQPYDAEDLAQFWLDFFFCQSSDDRPFVDDLTTTTLDTLQCEVQITVNETHLVFTTNGIPNHDFESTLACSQAGDCTAPQDYTWTIPRTPVNDTQGGHDPTNCPEAGGQYQCASDRGEIALAINGVPIYGPEDGPGGDAVASHHGVYNEDRQPIELGVCHGHAAQGGTYHYHADANCMHWHPSENESIIDGYNDSSPEIVASNTFDGEHSKVIGVALDGYPIYGFWGYDESMNVVEMRSSYKLKNGETGYNGIDDYEYIPNSGHLDVCNGHFGPTPEFPAGIYHYHTTMLNADGEMGFPYFLICYHGVVEDIAGDDPCAGEGETWGPGIGPPPPGCDPGPPPGTQANISSIDTNQINIQAVILFSLVPLLWILSRRTQKTP